MSLALNAKFAQRKLRTNDYGRIREAESRAMLLKEHDNAIDVVLCLFGKIDPPRLELVCVFNCQIFVHAKSIAYSLYRVN